MRTTYGRLERLALCFLALCAWGSTVAGATQPRVDRTAEVELVLTRFSAALSAGDADALRLLTTPDFILLEEGRAYDLDGTIASVKAVLSTGTLVRSPYRFHTQVRGDVAWSHYVVTGRFKGSKDPLKFALLESAVLERTRSGWRLALVTTIPQASAP
jgi:ketosteroid isomerase-like protein